jgi:hypothetical protein
MKLKQNSLKRELRWEANAEDIHQHPPAYPVVETDFLLAPVTTGAVNTNKARPRDKRKAGADLRDYHNGKEE